MDAFNFVNQVPALSAGDEEIMPTSDEDLIKLLGLSINAEDNNAGRRIDDLVTDLDLGSFSTSTVVPTAPSQGQFVVGGNFQGPHQPAEIISYVDLDTSENENTQYHLSGGYMINNEANVLPITEQEVSSPAPPTLVATQSPSPVAPTSATGYGYILDHNQQLVAQQQPEIIAYVDLDSASAPPTIGENQDTRQAAGGKAKGRKREPKEKLYQRKEPLASPEEEKRRQNAINAKMNRDKKKNEKQELENLVKSLTAERDALQTENTQLKTKSQMFESQLKAVCKQFNVPVVTLPQ